MSTLILTRGLPASGKSTWAKAWVAEDPERRARVNRDDLRRMIFDAAHLDYQGEQAVTAAQKSQVAALLKTGRDVVVDDTHLRPKWIHQWRQIAATGGHAVEVRDFPITPAEAIARDSLREQPVGADVIDGMARRFLRKGEFLPLSDPPRSSVPEPYVPLPGRPWAAICDIDGTLALHNGVRDPYDLTRCGEDAPNKPVIEALTAVMLTGVKVIYCSGREDTTLETPDGLVSVRGTTLKWLAEHVGIAGPLLMRPAGDGRRDSIVKRELFDKHIRDQYNIRHVWDDRNSVVDMWRALGLTVFQVAPGDF